MLDESGMAGPLTGIKVVELGFWIAGPATGGLLADWGADVIKIEPPAGGDPMRGVFVAAVGIDMPLNPPFELDNRGKRSIALDLKQYEAREIARRLCDQADVFLSNLRPGALERMGLDYETLSARNEGLVYCSVTGYGVEGPERDRAAYDIGAFWSRGGVAGMLTLPEGTPPVQRGGMGDHTTAVAASSAICAALVARGRTGKGQHVSTSLLRTGAYVVGWDVATRLRMGADLPPPGPREEAPNPVSNSYRAACGNWFWLICLQADRHWPDVCRAIERPDLVDDPRSKDIMKRREHARWLVGVLDEIFAAKTRDQWAEIFERENVWWAPVQTANEIATDEQMRATGGVVPYDASAGGEPEQLATPVDFHGTPSTPGTFAPEVGMNTEEILLESGLDWEEIRVLKERAIIP